eukprot:439508_1
MSADSFHEKAQNSLNRAIDSFNDDGEKNNNNEYEFTNTLNDATNISDKLFCQSIDLKSTLWDESTFHTSELWDMQSINFSVMNTSINTSIMSSDEITVSSNNKKSEKKILPTLASESILTPFQHIKTNKIPSFEEFTYDKNESDFVHFQGLSPPMCTFQIIRNSELHKNDNREYYRMLIPPIYDNQKILLLCCRKKKNVKKFRFSTDEFKMNKRNNPYYIGKMKIIKNEKNKCVTFMVSTNNTKKK